MYLDIDGGYNYRYIYKYPYLQINRITTKSPYIHFVELLNFSYLTSFSENNRRGESKEIKLQMLND